MDLVWIRVHGFYFVLFGFQLSHTVYAAMFTMSFKA